MAIEIYCKSGGSGGGIVFEDGAGGGVVGLDLYDLTLYPDLNFLIKGGISEGDMFLKTY